MIDTADVYSSGESEEIVGKALAGRRDEVVLATKFHGRMGEGPNRHGNSRRWIVQEVDASLRRLNTEWIDLYQVHRPEPDTDIDETLGALTDLVRAGKIRYLGCSTFPAARDRRGALGRRAARPGALPLRAAPVLDARPGTERDVLPVCERYGMGVISWSPLAGGWLSGRYRVGQELPPSTRSERIPRRYDMALPENQRKLEAVEQLALLAEEAGLSLVHLAIAFALRHPAISAAIIGPRTMDHLESQLDAADVRLSADVLDRIDEITFPGTNFNPHDSGYLPPGIADPSLRRRP